MNSASVGFQCPECVAEGNRTVRQARTAFGGRITGNAGVVTRILIGINVVAFILQRLLGQSATGEFWLVGVFVAHGEYYRLLTAAFLHASLLHIAFNMIALYAVGPQLEAALGRWRFLALYVLSALGGSVTSYLISSPIQAGLGASGAVFGLFGATLVVLKRMRMGAGGIAILIAVNLAIGFVVPGIDWRAHMGGLFTGMILAAAFAYAPRAHRDLVAVVACALVLLLELGIAAYRTAQLAILF
jgi:membrane associated rhomboid family serine protease